MHRAFTHTPHSTLSNLIFHLHFCLSPVISSSRLHRSHFELDRVACTHTPRTHERKNASPRKAVRREHKERQECSVEGENSACRSFRVEIVQQAPIRD